MITLAHRPLVLIILDGFGHREEQDANAIATAKTPYWDQLWRNHPHALIAGSGRAVGLPEGQMGNSEVGHLNMGAGRIVNQDLTRIDIAIENGEFFTNPVFIDALKQVKEKGTALHLMGLLSPGGVHSHEKHIFAMLTLAAKWQVPVYLHPFLDGRDTPPCSALHSLKALQALCDKLQCGKIVSLIGRFYAMDRDKRWERIEAAYQLLVEGRALFQAEDAVKALEAAYARGETDEFVQATIIHAQDKAPITINDGDIVCMLNFRSDRAREITQTFLDKDFTGFVRKKWPQLSTYICLSQYDCRFAAPVAFAPEPLTRILAECISEAGLKQLRIAETEKYAHVTFFFNGGIEKPYPLEERILIPSPKVATYDLQPEMSAPQLTDCLIKEIESGKYDVIICNFANPDMVGHSGNFAATVKAIETIDICLQKITEALLKVDGELIITADHGNAEQMFDYQTNQPHTAHTSDPIPFLFIGRKATITKPDDGKLSDIAPTMLYLLGLPIPPEMTGKTLLKIG